MHLRKLVHFPRVPAVVLLVLLAILEISCAGGASSFSTQPVQPTTPTQPVAPPPPPLPPPPPPPPPPATTDVQHVFIVVEENKNYWSVVGTSDMPFVNSLVKNGGLATNYFANGIDSLPNYFMLTVGDTVTTNASFSGEVKEDNVVRELIAANKTWKAYAESLPSVGYLGGDRPPYVKIHNPFAYLSDVVNSKAQADNIVPFTQFAIDLAAGTLPNYSFIIPNNYSNSHDCAPTITSCSLATILQYADDWLKTNIGPLLATTDFQQHGVLIVTWDESHSSTVNGGGHVAMIVFGSDVKPGNQSTTFYQHQSTLRLMMRLLGLKTYPNQAATAPDMDEFFTKPLP